MSLLKNPNQLNEAVKFAGLIYGQPGVGKSTLLLSAPNPVMIDADQGMRRVEKRFQVPSLQMTSYRDLLTLIASDELAPYDTIVIDTLGKLVDKIGDYLAEENPKNRKSDGALTMQGYGALKVEFARLVRAIKAKNKYLLFAAHEREEKDGDVRIVRPDVAGSSGKDLVKELDFMGYMEMRGSKRTISFTPTEKYYAKNSLGLPQVIDIPEPKSAAENNFIQKHIIEKALERMRADDEENKRYDASIASVLPLIAAVSDAKDAGECLATIEVAPVIWDNVRVLKAKLWERINVVGLAYDKATKTFKKAPPAAAETDKPADQPQQGEQTKAADKPAAETAAPSPDSAAEKPAKAETKKAKAKAGVKEKAA